MDWRGRKYYVSTFSLEAVENGVRNLKLIGNGVTIHFRRCDLNPNKRCNNCMNC